MSEFQKVLIILFITIIVGNVNAQRNTIIIPPSPNASLLAKFADIPISPYTGTYNLDIPIWTVNEKDLSLPISLSYHSGGLKVEEISPWTGANFALNAGGIIARTILGRADESGDYENGNTMYGYLLASDPFSLNYSLLGNEYGSINRNSDIYFDVFRNYAAGYLDTQPDMFYYNFGKYTGKFFLDKGGKPHLVPYQNLKIIPGENLSSWTIITPEGTQYSFYDQEKIASLNKCEELGETTGKISFPCVSSWSLSQIKSTNGNLITFEYEGDMATHQTSRSETIYAPTHSDNIFPYKRGTQICYSEITTNIKRLKSIKFSSGQIDFLPGEERKDYQGALLQSIIIKDVNLSQLKKIDLEYRYLSYNGLLKSSEATNMYPPEKLRLMLYKVTETDRNNISQPPYQFEYFISSNVPSRNSLDQDHWGFYNYDPDKGSNKSLIPLTQLSVMNGSDQQDLKYYGGANREPYLNAARFGTMNKVTYPTGGTSSFEYELNEINPDISLPYYQTIKRKITLHVDAEKAIQGIPQETPEFKLDISTRLLMFGENYPLFCVYNPGMPCDLSSYGFKILKKVEDGTFLEVYSHYANEVQCVTDLPDSRCYINLSAGIYKIIHFIRYSSSYINMMYSRTDPQTGRRMYYSYLIDFTYNEVVKNSQPKSGGLRVSKVINYDPINNKSTSKIYSYNDSNGKSTGYPSVIPVYYPYPYTEKTYFTPDGKCRDDAAIYDSFYLVISASTNAPLTTTQGSTVGYGMVTIYNIDQQNVDAIGKEENTFYTSKEFQDTPYFLFPFPQTQSFDWARGLLKTKTIYLKKPAGFAPIKMIKNTYNFFTDPAINSNCSIVRAVKFGFSFAPFEHPCVPFIINGQIDFVTYKLRSGYHELASTTETTYDQNDLSTIPKASTITTNYTYSTVHLQPIQTVTRTSDGRTLTTVLKYPADYSDAEGGTVINDMKSDARFMHNSAVEKTVIETIGNTSKVLHSQLTQYDYTPGDNGNTLILPREIAVLENSSPIDPVSLSKYIPASRYDINTYKRKLQYNYDTKGNPVLLLKENDIPSTYLWGYNSTYPIAEIKNATYADVQAVISQSIITQLASANPGTDEQVRQTLQVLRTDPRLKKAMVTTYTYAPLIGMTSKTDENNVTTYFEYDAFQRLKYAKDQDGKIIKNYNYHYQGQSK